MLQVDAAVTGPASTTHSPPLSVSFFLLANRGPARRCRQTLIDIRVLRARGCGVQAAFHWQVASPPPSPPVLHFTSSCQLAQFASLPPTCSKMYLLISRVSRDDQLLMTFPYPFCPSVVHSSTFGGFRASKIRITNNARSSGPLSR